jgi:ABC-type dipeptide/oligopeptide/nickel transport system permease component
MAIKHILIAVSSEDYIKYLKQKGMRTWREVLLDGLFHQSIQK